MVSAKKTRRRCKRKAWQKNQLHQPIQIVHPNRQPWNPSEGPPVGSIQSKEGSWWTKISDVKQGPWDDQDEGIDGFDC